MLKIIAWNVAGRVAPWRQLLLDSGGADIALLQEACKPPSDIAEKVSVDPVPWQTDGAGLRRGWRTVVAKPSDRVRVEWLEPKILADAHRGELAVSRLGTLAAAIVTPATGEPVVVASMYAPWEKPHGTTGSKWKVGYADASAHRVISDLSVLIGKELGHRIVAAGDLNILYGYGEGNRPDWKVEYWKARYASVFNRMDALGLRFVGPQAPAGRCADPWPDELPRSSKNVPTFYHSQQNPASATRQIDFVFASNSLAEHVHVTALNEPELWGPSDHCRLEIAIE